MPSPGPGVSYLELVGTFAVFGIEVVIPFLLYVAETPLSKIYLVAVTAAMWGGTLLSFIYSQYYMTVPWILVSIIVASLTVLSLVTVLAEIGLRSAPLWPLIALQILSLLLYLANVLTEYFAAPFGGLGPYLVYPMLYLAATGGLSLLAYALYSMARTRIGLKSALGYAAAAVLALLLAYPLYQLTIYNNFMAGIMSMVFAMGMGVLIPPQAMPIAAIFAGIYVFSIIALVVNGVVAKSPIRSATAVAALVYLTTAFVEHAVMVIFASIITVSNILVYLKINESIS
ncbi:hypothetical protein [Thermoproteus uzoniensis]|nr:hypothetical protein [Thermoproteus uzoniensis]